MGFMVEQKEVLSNEFNEFYLSVTISAQMEANNSLGQRGPTTGSRAACGPRNNFAQVLSITSSRNFFLENAMILRENRNFGDRFQDRFFF